MCSDLKAPDIKCGDLFTPKTVYVMNFSDVVIKDGAIVRVKRKYGKFKRPILKKEFE
tara:strand:- start:240 stop:410 length:171 start_codon:yes stop_codon:yes gene_type:complete